MIDYHLHTTLCRHASGLIEAYVEAAIKKGIHELAFTDHLPMPDGFDCEHRMDSKELDIYAGWIHRLRRQYPEIKIRHGIEADYYEGHESYLKKIFDRYNFDVIIMSVHFLHHWPEGNWVFNYSFPDKSIAEVYTDYVQTLIKGVKTGLFDIVGHIDLIKKPGDSLIRMIPEQISALLQTIAGAGMVVEINTSGYRKSVGESYPGFDWLPFLREHDIPITIGSDAHAPDQVGLNFKKVYKEVIQQKYKSVSIFNGRKRYSLKIDLNR